jgi:hypothetical protein
MNTLSRNRLAQVFVILTLIAAASSAWGTSPCAGVDRKIASQRKAALGAHIAKQLQVKNAEILNSFEYRNWSIFNVETHETDATYVFYSGDPATSANVTLWGGVALKNEERDIADWTLKNAPGIPRKLVSCFAWHVTNEP